jgi:hypothetical protein
VRYAPGRARKLYERHAECVAGARPENSSVTTLSRPRVWRCFQGTGSSPYRANERAAKVITVPLCASGTEEVLI